MRLTHLSTVSALALMLAIGGPAMAQTTAEQPADEPAIGTTGPTGEPTVGVTEPAGEPGVATDIERDRLALYELQDLMGEIGIEDSELFAGQAVVARTEDGSPVIMLIGPKDFEPGEIATLDMDRFNELRDRLSEAGFDQVRQDHAFQVVQGTLEGHYVFAASGEPQWDRDVVGELGIGEPGIETERDIGVAEPGEVVGERAIGEPATDDTMAGTDIGEPRTDDTMAGTDIGEPATDDTMADTYTGEPRTDDTMAGMDIAEPQTDDTMADAYTGEPRTDDTMTGAETTEPGVDITQPDVAPTERAMVGEFDRDRFEENLEQVGIEDRSEFQGKLVSARTEDGQSLKLLIGPERFAGDEEIELTEDKLREKLQDAGLTDVEVIEQDIAMVRGTYDDHSTLVIGGRGFMGDHARVGAAEPAMQPETGVTGMDPQAEITDTETAE